MYICFSVSADGAIQRLTIYHNHIIYSIYQYQSYPTQRNVAHHACRYPKLTTDGEPNQSRTVSTVPGSRLTLFVLIAMQFHSVPPHLVSTHHTVGLRIYSRSHPYPVKKHILIRIELPNPAHLWTTTWCSNGTTYTYTCTLVPLRQGPQIIFP